VDDATHDYLDQDEELDTYTAHWPLPNVWLGVSITNQADADERIPLLLQTPAAHRWVSAEPLLGPLNFKGWLIEEAYKRAFGVGKLDWVVVGGESGPGARPMHPDWARKVRDDCQAAGVPCFFKQWGEWQNGSDLGGTSENRIVLNDGRSYRSIIEPDQETKNAWSDYAPTMMARVGKKAAGHLLTGREHREMPEGLRV
jgi:protein gp37